MMEEVRRKDGGRGIGKKGVFVMECRCSAVAVAVDGNGDCL